MTGIIDGLKMQSPQRFVFIKDLLEYYHFMGNYNLTLGHSLPSSSMKTPFLIKLQPVTNVLEVHIK